MSAQYIYHFHAFTQKHSGELEHMDGILIRHTPIDSAESYNASKQVIATDFNCDRTKLTIASLERLL